MGVWAYMRHYLNLVILWSVLTTFKTIGPWELNWETQQYKCWIAQPITFFLLACLQLLNLFWFGFIVRIAYRAILAEPVTDDRSEEEMTEDEAQKSLTKPVNGVTKPAVEPVKALEASGIETATSMNGSTRTTRSKARAST